MINPTPIIPALAVNSNESAPNDASTVLDDISVNLVGRLPELIKVTKFSTSSSVKLPVIITSDANPCFASAADKQLKKIL